MIFQLVQRLKKDEMKPQSSGTTLSNSKMTPPHTTKARRAVDNKLINIYSTIRFSTQNVCTQEKLRLTYQPNRLKQEPLISALALSRFPAFHVWQLLVWHTSHSPYAVVVFAPIDSFGQWFFSPMSKLSWKV